VSQVFKLKYIILERDDLQSVDRFGELILDQDSQFGVSSNASESDYDTVSLLNILDWQKTHA
jgi:hypothetical protein